MKEKAKKAAGTFPGGFLTAVKENRRTVIRSAVYAAAALTFGGAELLFETAPLGLAFVCAAREGIPFAALGLVASALIAGNPSATATLSGLAVALAFRYALAYVLRRGRAGLFSLKDGAAPRISAAAAGGFTVSAIRVIYNGFRYYDLLAAAFYVVCACGAAFAYSCCLDRENRETQRFGAGLAAVMFSVVVSLSGVSLFGVSASVLAAFTLTLAAGRRGGALYGTAAGFLCGAAADFTLCPVFGITGFLCGLLSSFSAYIGILFSLVAGLFAGLQIGGFNALVSQLPEAAVAACLTLPSEYFGVFGKARRSPGLLGVRDESRSASAAAKDAAERGRQSVVRLSEAYCSLASAMEEISADERKPDRRAAAKICADAVSSFCAGCPGKSACFPDAGALGPVVDAVTAGKPLTEDLLPAAAREKCRHREALLAKLGVRAADNLRKLAESDRAGAAAESCRFTSVLLRASAASSAADAEEDAGSSADLAAVPLFREIFRKDVTVTGRDKKYITASCQDVRRVRQNAEELRRAAETALSLRLTDPEIAFEDGAAVFRAEQAPEFEAESASSGAAKEGRIVNGDSSFSARCGHKLYFAVCDGMGSGRDAAIASRLAGVTLGRLFYADVGASDALDSLNRLMRQRRTECFSTVDLLEFDTLNGSAVFYKCGACPSFVLREGNVYGISSRTPPVGIMEKLYAEKIELKLKAGDVVLMVSDGATGQTGDGGPVAAVLRGSGGSPSSICDAVLRAAEAEHGLKDDVTVMAVRISKAKKRPSGVI